jgi:hypothetical protein
MIEEVKEIKQQVKPAMNIQKEELKQEECIAWNQIRDEIQPNFVLSFGIPAQQLGILAMFKFNSSNSFDHCNFIFVDSLSTLQNNVALKKTLWTNILKPIFDK